MSSFDEMPSSRELPEQAAGMTTLERVANLVVAVALVVIGLYACFKPF